MKKFAWILVAALVISGMSLTSCKAGGSKKKGSKTGGDAAVTATAIKAGKVTFKFTPKDEAETVNIAGSFQGWNPSDPNFAMEKKGTEFVFETELEAGKYMWKFVIDGNWVQSMEDFKGQFSPDQGQYVDDGFGGKNCVLEIE